MQRIHTFRFRYAKTNKRIESPEKLQTMFKVCNILWHALTQQQQQEPRRTFKRRKTTLKIHSLIANTFSFWCNGLYNVYLEFLYVSNTFLYPVETKKLPSSSNQTCFFSSRFFFPFFSLGTIENVHYNHHHRRNLILQNIPSSDTKLTKSSY